MVTLNAIYELLEETFPGDRILLALVDLRADGSADVHASGTGSVPDLVARIHMATRGAPVAQWDDADTRH
jgi:hypothetical protein